MDPAELPLRDLHLPDPVGFWPPAPGWWLLAAFVLFGSGWLIYRLLKRRARGRARRLALRRLDAVVRSYTSDGDARALSTEASELLRRTMLAYAPRSEVAGLTGEDWLAWLDRDLDRPHFREGDGRPLVEWPYRPPGTEVDRSDVAAFVDVVRLRLRTPVGDAT